MNASSQLAASQTATQFLDAIKTNIINPLITVLALAAFVVFIWGVVEFIRNAGEPEKRAEGQQHMLWGIIGFVIIFGATAIINILKATFGIS